MYIFVKMWYIVLPIRWCSKKSGWSQPYQMAAKKVILLLKERINDYMDLAIEEKIKNNSNSQMLKLKTENENC